MMGGSCCGVVHEVVIVGPPVHRCVSPCYGPGCEGLRRLSASLLQIVNLCRNMPHTKGE